MKRVILLMMAIIVLGGFCFVFYLKTMNLFESNKKYYEYFNDEKLVGIDGKINLSGIEAEKDDLYNDLVNLFQQKNYDYNVYLKEIEDKKSSNEDVQKEIENLSIEINNLEEKKNSLNSEHSVLVKKYDKLKASLNSVSKITSNSNNDYKIPLINQYPNYPTGCESVALTMLLQYYGVVVTPDMIISNLRKGSLPYWEVGVLYGGNPEVEFIGNPYSSSSYGVYEGPIAEVANMYKSGIQVKNNFAFNEVINLVRNGTPVMVWTSMGLSLPYISKSWIYKPTMETIYWKSGEHAVVMVGVSNDTVTIADPIGGTLKVYSLSLFERRYNYFGKKALYY